MLPIDRVLTSRLLATLGNPTLRSQVARCRRHTSFNQFRIKGHASKSHEAGIHIPPKLDLAARKKLLQKQQFIHWLIDRLDHLIRAVPNDNGFSTFLTNVKTAARSHRLRGFLDERSVKASSPSSWHPSQVDGPRSLLETLKNAFLITGENAVDTQLRYSYHGLLASRNLSKINIDDQQKLADLRYPVEWYPATRAVQRTIHLHVGPTNSGKTYHALKRLEQANSGVYGGPLRLLAHEVYARLNARGKICDLVTGDERILKSGVAQGSCIKSCTVEMIPLNTYFDVAVVDEIQMIGHEQRGWAWTQALLGLKAREVHLCGEERTVPLIRELVASMGDKLEIHTYKRLSPLKTMSASLHGSLSELRKGDCVVVFSRVGIHAMKRDIERATQRRVAIVYGSLPPETRAQQARLFNDPENDYDVLVASDAIGMGLNLAIKRIIFESVSKFNGSHFELIEPAQIKQIAGRAGRFRTAAQAEAGADTQLSGPLPSLRTPNLGLVTTLEDADLPILRKAMQTEPEPIMSAGIFPPTNILMQFAAYFPPSSSFSYILLRLHEISLLHPRFKLCDLKEQVGIADIIQAVPNLTTRDRITLCASPASTKGQNGLTAVLRAFATCIAENRSGALLDIPQLGMGLLDEEITLDRGYMERLESLHKALILYLWLSYRFAGVFINQAMAFYVKGLVEERIDKMLAEFSASPAIRARIQKMREKAMQQIQKIDEHSSDSEQESLLTQADSVSGLLVADAETGQESTDLSLVSSEMRPSSQSKDVFISTDVRIQ